MTSHLKCFLAFAVLTLIINKVRKYLVTVLRCHYALPTVELFFLKSLHFYILDFPKILWSKVCT